MERKKILFISRKYPPVVGGMQTYAKNLLNNLKNFYDVDAILLGKNQVHLIWFLPYALIRAVYLSRRSEYEILYLADALLAPIGLIIKIIFRTKTIITVHGLDITYNNFLYQRVIPPALSKLDRLVCVSRNTLKECVNRNIPSRICATISNGVNIDEYYLNMSKDTCLEKLQANFKSDLKSKKILLTTGRLVRRKGIDWFLENVFVKLDGEFIYLICGKGPLAKKICATVIRLGLKDRVMLLGEVSHDTIKLLYNCAHAYIMPNQRIEGDPEGFGIVAIEAASCGVPVIANDVDGVSDAVINGVTGWLIKENDAGEFISRIKSPELERQSIRKCNLIFSWANVIQQYKKAIED